MGLFLAVFTARKELLKKKILSSKMLLALKDVAVDRRICGVAWYFPARRDCAATVFFFFILLALHAFFFFFFPYLPFVVLVQGPPSLFAYVYLNVSFCFLVVSVPSQQGQINSRHSAEAGIVRRDASYTPFVFVCLFSFRGVLFRDL